MQEGIPDIKRIAVIADVHGNLPALQAVLAAIEEEGCDLVEAFEQRDVPEQDFILRTFFGAEL